MGLYSIILSKDYAWEIMDEIGKKNALHFIDLNQKGQVYARPYASCIKRCDEAERKIKYSCLGTANRYIEAECKRYSIPIHKPKSVAEFLGAVDKLQADRRIVCMLASP